jgi:hypothetical protein
MKGHLAERYLNEVKLKVNLGPHLCLGDALTGVAAAVNLKCEACNPPFRGLLELYPALSITDDSWGWENYMARIVQGHLIKDDANGHLNYVGVMMAAAGQKPTAPPPMICPPVLPLSELQGRQYAVLQPKSLSNHANDLSEKDMESLIKWVKNHLGLETVIAGKPAPHTPTDIRGAVYCLGDAANYLRVVAYAQLALGSESAIAHIAAGYGVPMVMWVRQEREPFMWLFNYPGWKKTICRNDLKSIKEALQ